MYFFFDPWPDRFFLQDKKNEIGAVAQLHRGTSGQINLVSISKIEFAKSIIGLITRDEVKLVNQYMRVYFRDHSPLPTIVQLSNALQWKGDPVSISEASHLLNNALTKAPNALSDCNFASAYYRSNLCASLLPEFAASKEVFNRRLEVCLEHVDKTALELNLTAFELFQIGYAYGQHQDYAYSRIYFDQAIQDDPTFLKSFFWKAAASFNAGALKQAIADFKIFVDKNQLVLDKLKKFTERYAGNASGERDLFRSAKSFQFQALGQMAACHLRLAQPYALRVKRELQLLFAEMQALDTMGDTAFAQHNKRLQDWETLLSQLEHLEALSTQFQVTELPMIGD